MTIDIVHGDALALPVADASVDLVVTSPPYFGLRSYRDGGEHYDGQIGAEATPAEFVDAIIAATREMVRVVKPTGSIWVNLGDKYGPGKSLRGIPWRYALRCMDDLRLLLRAEVIWAKPNPMPESPRDRVRRSHEQWFHFTLQSRYFSALDEVREPYATAPDSWGHTKGAQVSYGISRSTGYEHNETKTPNGRGRVPGSVWSIPTQGLRVPASLGVDHFAAFPMELPRRVIRGWCPEGGTVLDPFGGTGTTALVASALGRHGISVDMSADYCRLAEWRTTDPKQIAKAAA